MHALRALALVAPLLWSCAGPGATNHHEQRQAWERSAPAPAGDDPFAGHATLERGTLVAAVLARNPSIAAARWAWRAALARHPQQTALDDPMLAYELAPLSIGEPDMDTGQRVTLSQAFPFPGKLALRGEVALAEAEAAASDFAAVRLRMAALASLLFDELYLIERKLAVNDAHRALLVELREVAVARYEAGTATQQDPLEAELAEAELLHRDVVLRTDRRIALEQMNVLLHRSPELPLPPLPPALDEPPPDPARDEAGRAAGERPELRAAEARVRAREAAVGLARREVLPDLRLMGGYDAMEEEDEMRPVVGLEVNIPLRRTRRAAMLDEAQAELEEARAEHAGLADQVRFSVARALERLAEARHAHEILRDRVLPAARDRVASARAAFETGQSSFSVLIDAERSLRDAELGHEEALVEVSRRHTELARALGELPRGGRP
jgi:cobalt-zinc-cadmium efflux system outer membrane protein